jgi:hypothetical protein
MMTVPNDDCAVAYGANDGECPRGNWPHKYCHRCDFYIAPHFPLPPINPIYKQRVVRSTIARAACKDGWWSSERIGIYSPEECEKRRGQTLLFEVSEFFGMTPEERDKLREENRDGEAK